MYLHHHHDECNHICMPLLSLTETICLQYVKKQTDEICKLTIQQNGNTLSYHKSGIGKL